MYQSMMQQKHCFDELVAWHESETLDNFHTIADVIQSKFCPLS